MEVYHIILLDIALLVFYKFRNRWQITNWFHGYCVKVLREFPQLNIWDCTPGVDNVFRMIDGILPESNDVVFEFNKCKFLSAEAIAIMVGIKLLREKRGLNTALNIDTLTTKLKKVLIKSRCMEFFGRKPPRWNNNSLPIFVQEDLEKQEIADYIENEIFQRQAIPKMTKDLEKEIGRSIFEIFGNVFHHSESIIGGLVCGQIYPRRRRIQIVFYDAGIGIAACVRRKKNRIKSDIRAIEWSLEPGTSTLSRRTQSRGLGLFLLRSFIKENGGDFRIYSNRGYIEEIGGFRKGGELSCNCCGTLIDIRINIRPKVVYMLEHVKGPEFREGENERI